MKRKFEMYNSMESFQLRAQKRKSTIEAVLAKLESLRNMGPQAFHSPVSVSLEDKLRLISVENERLKAILLSLYEKLSSNDAGFDTEVLAYAHSLESMTQQKSREVETLRTSFSQREQSILALNSALEECRRQLSAKESSATRELIELRHTRKVADETNISLQSTVEDLRVKLQQADRQLKEELTRNRTAKTSTEEQLTRMTLTIQDLRGKQDSSAKQFAEQTDALRQTKREAERTIEKLNSTIASLEKKLESKESEISSLYGSARFLESQLVSRSHSQPQAEEKSVATPADPGIATELRVLREKEMQLQSELTKKALKHSEAKERLAGAEKALADLQMTAKFEALRSQKQALENASLISALRNELESVKAELANKSKSLETLNSKLSEMKWAAMAQETQSKIAERERHLFERNSVDSDEHKAPPDASLQPPDRIGNMIVENSMNDRLLHQKIRNLESRIEEEKLNASANLIQAKEASKMESENIVSSLMAKLERANSDGLVAIKKYEKAKAENKKLESELKELSARTAKLEADLKIKTTECERLENAKSSADPEEPKLNGIAQKSKTASVIERNLKSEVESLKTELKRKDEELRVLKSIQHEENYTNIDETAKLKEKLRLFSDQLARLKKSYIALKEENEKLLKALQQELETREKIEDEVNEKFSAFEARIETIKNIGYELKDLRSQFER